VRIALACKGMSVLAIPPNSLVSSREQKVVDDAQSNPAWPTLIGKIKHGITVPWSK
jgi:hypothetical protein